MLILALCLVSLLALYALCGWLAQSEHVYVLSMQQLFPGFTDDNTRNWHHRLKIFVVALIQFTVVLSAMLLLVKLSADIFTVLVSLTFVLTNTVLIGLILNPRRANTQRHLALVIAVAMVVLQRLYPNWLTTDLLALSGLVCLLMLIADVHRTVLTIISVAIFLHDIKSVYFSDTMIELVEHNDLLLLPLVVTIPEGLSLASEPFMQIGLGDLAIPGIWAMLAWRQAKEMNQPLIVISTFSGIALGWVASLTVLFTTGHPVPAMMTLMPCTMAGFYLFAWRPRRA